MAIQLRLENIQGNVTPGFRSDHQAFMLIRLPGLQAARRWLRELHPRIASAKQVATFMTERRAGSPGAAESVVWVNLAFSMNGLRRLAAPSLDSFPTPFRRGAHDRASMLGENPIEVLEWEVGGSSASEADVIVLLAARSSEHLELEYRHQLKALADRGGTEIKTYFGQRLPGELRSHEHFGYRDGISQPDPADPLPGWQSDDEIIAPGEFILGYPDETGAPSSGAAGWTRDGSYLVFRRLRQDVYRFRAAIEREARRSAYSPEHLAGKLLGRWPSGAKLAHDGAEKDPGWTGHEAARLSESDFADDQDGERIPRFAHIRKAFPRDRPDLKPRRHRLIRRGIPYGEPLPQTATRDDCQDRGLLFLCYQASIERQFEHVQRKWLEGADFPRHGDGVDPLVGRAGQSRALRLRQKGGGSSTVNLEPFVSVTAGGYFFAPSLKAVAYLADPKKGIDKEDSDMPYDAAARDLGEFILEENPYSPDGKLRVGFQATSKIDDRDRDWEFDGASHRISRAIRVEYSYRDRSGQIRTEHLLIGYEGGSGN